MLPSCPLKTACGTRTATARPIDRTSDFMPDSGHLQAALLNGWKLKAQNDWPLGSKNSKRSPCRASTSAVLSSLWLHLAMSYNQQWYAMEGNQGTFAALSHRKDNQNGNVRNATAVECLVSPTSCCDVKNGLLQVSHRWRFLFDHHIVLLPVFHAAHVFFLRLPSCSYWKR